MGVGSAITADPILPPHAAVTTGLKSPDGIVGTLPSYPGAPAQSTVVLYTEKQLALLRRRHHRRICERLDVHKQGR